MTIKQFIEKAIEGGWEPYGQQNSDWRDKDGMFHSTHADSIFLDPKSWQAVGKAEGWRKMIAMDEAMNPEWKHNMHRMIDALAEGKSIEDYIATL